MAAREPVDLILLDVLMPGLSGYEVLSRLKADAALREIPVLMISALDQTASVTRCIALGADDYLTKPFDPLVLRARVNSCLRKKWARDFELAYLRGVGKVTAAALAVEAGSFTPESLDDVGERADPLGNLARLFQRMGVEVAARERRLRDQVEQLVIAIDEKTKGRPGRRDHRVRLFSEAEGPGQGAGRPQRRAHQHPGLTRRRPSAPHHGQDRLHSFVPRRDRQVEPDRQPGRVPRVLWKASGGRRHRHPVARDPHALRARRHEPLANAQRLLVGALPGPRGGDGRDASSVREAGGRVWLVPSSVQAGEIAKVLREGYDVGLMNDGLRDLADHLSLDYLLIDTHPGLNEETLLSIAISDVLVVLLRPDRQDFQGTAVTVEVARKLEVQELVLVLNKVLPSVAAGGFVRGGQANLRGTHRGRAARGAGDVGAWQQRAVYASFPDHPLSREIRRVASRLE